MSISRVLIALILASSVGANNIMPLNQHFVKYLERYQCKINSLDTFSLQQTRPRPLGIAFFDKPRQKYEEASGVQPLDYCHADIQQVKWALENLCGFFVVIFEDACKSDSTQS